MTAGWPSLDAETTTSSELLQAHLPGSKVVKAFNVIYFKHLEEHAQPAGSNNRRALPIAGNDAQAKKTVAGLIDTFGFDVIDTGPLSEGWRFQPDLPAYYHRHNAEEAQGGARQGPALRRAQAARLSRPCGSGLPGLGWCTGTLPHCSVPVVTRTLGNREWRRGAKHGMD
ncbi:NADPH-dependent F420 reductase [Archangium gephyra]|uniref:NADPH-dependent F420 reductase n=1 Tax=Archangium gephyra TaxID=48 RepID=UPI003B7CF648